MPLKDEDILEEIRDQLASIKIPGALEATPDNTWEELDVDSLDMVELVKALEDKYDVVIDEKELKQVNSIGETIALIQRLLG